MESTSHSRAITYNEQSAHTRWKSINVDDCTWTSGFWFDKIASCDQTMIPHMGQLLKGDIGHAYNNFKIAAGLMQGEAKGMMWHDGDFYKWMEALIYSYLRSKDDQVLEELDKLIDVIAQAQQPDGYLSTHIQINQWPRWTQVHHHELYNCGHLLTTACLHHRLTGKSNFLEIAVKNANHLYETFSSRAENLARFGFNPSQIMGLVELFRTTQDKRHLELAGIFVDMRGSVPMTPHASVPYWFLGDQCQMRTPIREETEAVGHAVLAMYLYAGAADVYAETGEKALFEALQRLWSSAVERKMYLTGAVGQVHHGARGRYNMIHEGFLDDYLMPNTTAYNETCANVANAMFNWRMLNLTGEAKYGDVMERVLYNSALVGISHDGKHYFYANPLRMVHGTREYTQEADCTESADREQYIECFCCPPNLVRTISKVSGWAYLLTENGLAVNLYGSNQLETKLGDGSAFAMRQQSEYPWDGTISCVIDSCKADPFAISFRIPSWANEAQLTVNGQPVDEVSRPGTFCEVVRSWKPGDIVNLDLPMSVTFVEGHPLIEEVRNQVAVQRGPLIYCLESPDLPEEASILDVYLDGHRPLIPEHKSDLLGGVTVLKGEVMLRTSQRKEMYTAVRQPQWRIHPTSFIPYYAWSNRGQAEMSVFFPIVWQAQI